MTGARFVELAGPRAAEIYPIDTAKDLAVAQARMAQLGVRKATVWLGSHGSATNTFTMLVAP